MATCKKNNARRWWITAAVLALALIGLLSINPGSVTADRSYVTSAQTAATSTDTPAESATGFETGYAATAAPSIAKMLSALILVVFAIYVTIYLLKRLSRKRAAGSRNDTLEVMETVFVAPKKSVSLIRVAGKSVVVGVTDNGMSLLTELTAEETAAIAQTREAEEGAGFRDLLQNATDKMRSFRFGKDRTALES